MHEAVDCVLFASMFVPAESRRVELPGDLILRTVESRDDIERLAEFNARIHEDEVGVMTQRLLLEHPATLPRHWPLVEHPRDGIVSALCLIPWRMRMGEAELTAGEMGIVGTRPEYRKRGLVRRLAQYFDHEVEAGEFDFTHIQGIPFFYRQFGYDYAVPLIPDLRLDPAAVAQERCGYHVRKATGADSARLCELAGDAAEDLDLGTLRDEAIWHYLLEGPSSGEGETWCLCRGRNVEGYFRTHREGFGSGLIVSEASRLTDEQAAVVLGELGAECGRRAKPYIKIEADPGSDLATAARGLGARDLGHYAWQIRVANPAKLLGRLGPVFAGRLERSTRPDLDGSVGLDLYKTSLELAFAQGRLVAVREGVSAGVPRLRLPPFLLAPLLMGYRSAAALATTYHDASVPEELREVVEILFPPLRAWFATQY